VNNHYNRFPEDQCCNLGTLAGRVRFARLDDAGLVGQDDGLDPVAQAELGEQVADVGFHGGVADEEVGGDLGVGEAAGEPQQDVVFPGGQRCQPGRCEQRVARGGVLDGRDQVMPFCR
jgi:hypothetical protein